MKKDKHDKYKDRNPLKFEYKFDKDLYNRYWRKLALQMPNDQLKLDDKYLDIVHKFRDIFPPLESRNYDRLKLDSLNFLHPDISNINEFKSNFTNHLLDNSSLNIYNPLTNGIEETSIVELEIDSYEKINSEEQQVAKIINTTPKIIKSIYEDHNILKIIDPRKFEDVVAELLNAKGFQVQLTKQTKDGGYDIFAISEVCGFPIEMIVECKRYKNTVGVDIVRSFCDVINLMKPNKGLIVTTSYFSPEAEERKRQMGAVLDLHDRDDLLKWIVEYMGIKRQ